MFSFLKWFFIPTQLIFFLLGSICLLYGAFRLVDTLNHQLRAVTIAGKVIGHNVEYEHRERFPNSPSGSFSQRHDLIPVYRPVIQYRFPEDGGAIYSFPTRLTYESKDNYPIGKEVPVTVHGKKPGDGREKQPFLHLAVAGVFFLFGLIAVFLLGRFFFAFELLGGSTPPESLSLFRSFSPQHLLVPGLAILVFLAGGYLVAKSLFPWLGSQELAAITSGELRHLPPLLIHKHSRRPGTLLNPAEQSIVGLPYLGKAYASLAVEWSLRFQQKEHFQRFIEAYTDPKVHFPIQSNRALPMAAAIKGESYLDVLLAAGFDPNRRPYNSGHPLYEAVKSDHAEAIDTLIAAGAAVDDQNELLTLAETALFYNSARAFGRLLHHDLVDQAWRDPVTGYHYLDKALDQGAGEIARQLLAEGWTSQFPPFYIHGVTGDLEALTRIGPPSTWPNLQHQGRTLLHVAALTGNRELAEALIASGANLETTVYWPARRASFTPLAMAVSQNRPVIVSLLCRTQKVNLEQTDQQHQTLAVIAAKAGNWEILDILISHGANPNVKTQDTGKSLLHMAAEHAQGDRVQQLLAAGADPKAVDFSGRTALDIARGDAYPHLKAGIHHD